RPIAGMGCSGNRRWPQVLGLRTVIALDDNKISNRVRLPNLDVGLVFRRVVAGECGRIVGKFDHDVARTALSLDAVELAAANDIAPAEFLEDRGVRRRVGLVALVVM